MFDVHYYQPNPVHLIEQYPWVTKPPPPRPPDVKRGADASAQCGGSKQCSWPSTWNQYWTNGQNPSSIIADFNSLSGSQQAVIINTVAGLQSDPNPQATITALVEAEDLYANKDPQFQQEVDALFQTILQQQFMGRSKATQAKKYWEAMSPAEQEQFAVNWLTNNATRHYNSFDKAYNHDDLYSALEKAYKGHKQNHHGNNPSHGGSPWVLIGALGVVIGVVVLYNERNLISSYV